MKFLSKASWPAMEITGGKPSESSDTHHSREAAQAVCSMLFARGFGGDGMVFPLKVWVEEVSEPGEIYKLALQFRNVAFELEELRKREFPIRAVVYVQAPRYTGYGLVAFMPDVPDQLAVTLPNGNTWWYPIECVERAKDLKAVPPEVRRLKIKLCQRERSGVRAISVKASKHELLTEFIRQYPHA